MEWWSRLSVFPNLAQLQNFVVCTISPTPPAKSPLPSPPPPGSPTQHDLLFNLASGNERANDKPVISRLYWHFSSNFLDVTRRAETARAFQARVEGGGVRERGALGKRAGGGGWVERLRL
ncbi:hypothetical protein BaRGS_00034497 [Batillaria attramentaria]|uniref:Uncharacterized protein n=1 Tax=Batillaria attramentaria TaxID=370345 RepID=A0ABD0JHC9_9CAEN